MTKIGTSVRGLALAAVCCLAVASPALAQRDNQKSSPKVLAAFKEVVAAPSKAVVQVRCGDKDVALGTVIGSDGWILTKASLLVKDAEVTCKTRDGETYAARVTGVEEKHDLAMLKIDAKGLAAVKLQESKGTPVGYWVASVGPGDEPVAVGVLSVASRNPSPRENPRTPNQNSGFLGVNLGEDEGKGAKLSQVIPDSAAEKAGLKANDHILAVDGKEIDNGDTLVQTLSKYKPDDTVTLKVMRGEEELELKAKLGKRSGSSLLPERGDIQNRMGSVLSDRRNGFPTILTHDSVVKPEHCGGPLVNLDGEVIGINIARAGRTESYALPSETVQPLLTTLKSGQLAPVSTTPVENEKVKAAREVLVKAEKELADVQKKVEAARQALKQAEEEAKKDKK